jgi:glycosyltransferase involved in cell wall biosynthesis
MAIAFPDAPVVAILGRPAVAARMGVADRLRTVLPARPALYRRYRLLTPVLGALVDRVRLDAADVVLSSSYAFAHRFGTINDAARVCYCHSPLRFAWTMTESYRRTWAPSAWRAPAFEALAAAMRRSDRRSAQRIATYLTQSPYTADQIGRFYGRSAEVIGAPIDTELFRPGAGRPDDYYLVCGRLIEPYKRVSVVIEAFRRIPARLVVAGDGPALSDLRAMAPPNVEFTGHLEDAPLVDLMQRCRAAIFPSRDDFGLIPLEVQACGRPVLAFAGGGAVHTVAAGRTGELFGEQTGDAVHAAVEAFDPDRYDPATIRAHAERWDRTRFRQRLVDAVRAAATDGAPA